MVSSTIEQDVEKKQNIKNSLSSVGVSSSEDDNDTSSNIDKIGQDYLKK